MALYKSIDLSAVIKIDDWHALDEELAGSRVKRTMANPQSDELFVFKEPKAQREAQIWSELIASFISGDLLEWPVQHAQIAMRDGRVGNLLKYVYDPHLETFLAGEQFCKHVDPGFDPVQGKRHTWELIKKIHNGFLGLNEDGTIQNGPMRDMYFKFWARTIAFDTLISNTDRHAENWAILRSADDFTMAAFYDNASSLGCEVENNGLNKWFSKDDFIIESKVSSYTANGCHHLREGDIRFKFEALTKLVLNELPEFRSEFEAIANLDLNPVEGVLNDICAINEVPEPAKMTSRRRVQITRLLQEGQARVIRALKE
ncbi:MAG: hypothetical protein JKY41_07685 [Rhodobacteraceae bacterium]|nr:hypothetical protein [Paracoccaceae bacterium]